MNTPDENNQQSIHEERMRTDIEYATQFLSDSVYDDLPSFIEFMEENQMMPIIARELQRALCNSNTPDTTGIRHNAVIDALSNIKIEIDAKIQHIAENHNG